MLGNDKNILILQIFQKKGGIHMNIIHTGDWHLGKTIEGHSRLPEQELFLNDLVSICEERQPDMIIIAFLLNRKKNVQKWRLYGSCNRRQS